MGYKRVDENCTEINKLAWKIIEVKNFLQHSLVGKHSRGCCFLFYKMISMMGIKFIEKILDYMKWVER